VAGHAIAVVGAGIAGLTAALVLARQGHAVTLIERRTGFSEIGAGLQLSPNASRILLALGLGPALRRVAGEPERVVVRAIRSGAEIGGVALGAFMHERFGAPYWVVHRADLQRILLDAARSDPAIRLLMGRTVEEAASGPDAATLGLLTASGGREVLTVDAVIGADGVWSKLRRSIGETEAPQFCGYVAWRATLARERIPWELASNETGLWLGRRGHVVHYPIAGGRLLNIVAIERTDTPVDGWAAPGDGAALLSRYASATPTLRSILAGPSDWHLWSLFDRPARRLAKDRIALIGDAAHPVLPFLAQGAALAIEDARTLAATLGSQPDSAVRALREFERQRLHRVRRVQREARRNGQIYHACMPIALARNWVMRGLGPERMTDRYAWLYGFAPFP
jgi:salicylate hydroxylase